jgi:hypothetical protein
MGLVRNLKLRFLPPSVVDPDFGRLLYQFIPEAPAASYWEAEWNFPSTGTSVLIDMPGGEDGPLAEGRRFYLDLPDRFDRVLAAARPRLEAFFREWLGRDLPQDLFTELELISFGLENPTVEPVEWQITFATKADKNLDVTIPFLGDEAQEAVVDT